ncbi:peptidylprolyl isomerase [Candidatus Poseidoniales archaeon]|jgi:FKBP-type peptidyl-prolyl cis-trans isomerase SlyD|nr:peptidylprolyl isomerase [Candidatus Poseidoniales archaeon]MDA8790358.1 peptidylprolyl isomerase [bacterium]MDB0004941.1 peptidylprolyl isomerase [Candidatus Poseidoniaceae archaeon]MDA8550640.1 peptidylprolyl isomerase [Candidatus Poseidoniales archaeon]MDA8555760.1 peptidylprolyl isomerase [Candidatus Poseidoniales archaeon]
MTENTVSGNMVASVHYKGTLPENGEVFDSSEGREPLTFLVGHKQMIPGFEEEIMGAKVGETREFTLSSDRAYGDRDNDAVMEIPREQFAQLEQEATLETGMQLVAQMPHGPSPFTITSLTEETVTADFNHALAGQSLTFSVEIVELREATEEELAHGHVHGPDGHHDH